ncbi:hypothetical protein GCM10010392_32850 [Streptomyces clavifer]|nr:hypothetical protein GCM10010392_32850 [Streptomyces clavifer]
MTPAPSADVHRPAREGRPRPSRAGSILVRPDGYPGLRTAPAIGSDLLAHLDMLLGRDAGPGGD